MESKSDSHRWFLLERSFGRAIRRPILFQWEKQNGNRMQIAGCDREMVGVARVLICTFTMEPQTFDFLVTSRECVDHGF